MKFEHFVDIAEKQAQAYISQMDVNDCIDYLYEHGNQVGNCVDSLNNLHKLVLWDAGSDYILFCTRMGLVEVQYAVTKKGINFTC